MSLTKDKLIANLQNQIGITKPESRQHVEQLLEIIKSALANGDKVLISGFGKFSVKQKHERRGRNPQTKEKLILKARKVLVFKASGVLREKLNEE
jgi:integration host factor subunit alpha